MNNKEKFEALLKVLAQNVAPWKIAGEKSLPYNFITQHFYHAMNALILIQVAAEHGYEGSNWLTCKQANEAGGRVKRGAKGTQIHFRKKDEIIDEVLVKLEKPHFAMCYVFHQNQIEGVDFPEITPFYASPEASLNKEIYLEALRQKDPQNPIFGTREREELRIAMAQVLVSSRYGLKMETDPRDNRAFERLLEEDPRELFRSAYSAEELFKTLNLRWGQNLTPCGERLLNTAEMEATETITIENNTKVLISRIQKEKEDRTWLVVPYSEKEEAKALARENGLELKWDRESKAWYTTGNPKNAGILKKWLPENKEIFSPLSPEEQDLVLSKVSKPFIEKEPQDPKWKTTKHQALVRLPSSENEEATIIATMTWSEPVEELTPQDIEQQRQEKERWEQEREEEWKQLYLKNIDTLKAALSKPQKPVVSRYLAEKEVKQHAGVVIVGQKIVLDWRIFARPGDLIIPLQNLEGEVRGCQRIESRQGRKLVKRYSPDVHLSGHFFPIGDVPTAKNIVIAEGYASAASLFEAAGRGGLRSQKSGESRHGA